MTVFELRERLGELNDQSVAIVADADTEKRDLTDEDRRRLKDLKTDFDRTNEEIEAREAIDKQTKELAEPMPRLVKPADPVNSPADLALTVGTSETNSLTVGTDREFARPVSNRGSYGWRSYGEFAKGVRLAGLKGGDQFVDNRLRAHASLAPTTYGNEGAGADGGFAIPPDFRAEIVKQVEGEASLLQWCDRLTSSGNSITVPIDATTPWQTSGGLLAFWENENAQLTQSKPALQQNTVRLNKVTALVPMTEELMDDAPALGTYLMRKAPEKILFKVNLAIVKGTGAGQPLGLANSPALVSVAKRTSQVADTVVANNIVDMWSRMYAPSRLTAVWLVSQDVEPWLMTMTMPGRDDTGAVASGFGFQASIYNAPGGIVGSPNYGTLLGRPVVVTQACETVGDLGDIYFADLKQYMAIEKVGGIRAETSIHLWFDYDTTAFRFIYRIGGLPWWQSTLSQRDGSNTLSPYITLAVRG